MRVNAEWCGVMQIYAVWWEGMRIDAGWCRVMRINAAWFGAMDSNIQWRNCRPCRLIYSVDGQALSSSLCSYVHPLATRWWCLRIWNKSIRCKACFDDLCTTQIFPRHIWLLSRWSCPLASHQGTPAQDAQDAHAMNEEATHENQEIHKTGSQPNTIHRHIHHKLPDIFWPNRKDVGWHRLKMLESASKIWVVCKSAKNFLRCRLDNLKNNFILLLAECVNY